MKVRKIYTGSDHGGFALKIKITDRLLDNGFELQDMGCTGADLGAYRRGEKEIDYPEYAHRVALEVVRDEGSRGILVCGTGIGMCMAANKVPGARAALCTDPYMAEMARSHNDANILCLGERITHEAMAMAIVNDFLAVDFSPEERHSRRVLMIEPDYPRRD